jgi:peptide/nickel transport system permease protein
VTGNLGTSLVSSQSVGAALSARLPVPLSLVIGATVLSAMLGIGLGAVSSLRGGVIGQAIDALAMLSFAVPSFWLGLILVDRSQSRRICCP